MIPKWPKNGPKMGATVKKYEVSVFMTLWIPWGSEKTHFCIEENLFFAAAAPNLTFVVYIPSYCCPWAVILHFCCNRAESQRAMLPAVY